MTEQQETILEKVKKLLALAGNNPSQEEAEAAMMKAQALLSEHGLTMAQAEASMGVKQEAKEYAADDTGTQQAPWWHKRISNVIAKNYRCDTFTRMWSGSYGGRGASSYCVFVGLPVDAEIAREMFRLAISTASREAKRYLRIEKKKAAYWDRSKSISLRNDYLRGWIWGLETSFRKNVESNALVVVIPEEVEDHMSKMKLRRVSCSPTASAGSGDAHRAGETDGSRFGKRGQIGS